MTTRVDVYNRTCRTQCSIFTVSSPDCSPLTRILLSTANPRPTKQLCPILFKMKSAVAVSRVVNPPNTKTVLTESQVWKVSTAPAFPSLTPFKGLGLKARDPAPFVPQIEKCDVLVDEPNHVCTFCTLSTLRADSSRLKGGSLFVMDLRSTRPLTNTSQLQ